MQEICLLTWEAFEEQLALLEAARVQKENDESSVGVSEILFRGQTQSCWKLVTSLERVARKPLRLRDYYRVIDNVKPEIEAFTDQRWKIPRPHQYARILERDKRDVHLAAILGFRLCIYEYMAHLRHHGFPSPLLDWTTSPYIAAYFAFKDATDAQKAVAIYAYLEYAGQGKSGELGKPWITGLGPHVRTHPRHFLQKSRYTICTLYNGTDHEYAAHEQVFARDDEDQDLLWKFVLPASERRKVLRCLDRYNIRSFSLFRSEESLMESLAIQEFTIHSKLTSC